MKVLLLLLLLLEGQQIFISSDLETLRKISWKNNASFIQKCLGHRQFPKSNESRKMIDLPISEVGKQREKTKDSSKK